MGEGVTNLVGGAASNSSSTDSDSSSLLLHDTSFHILILLSVTCIVIIHWILRRRGCFLSKQSINCEQEDLNSDKSDEHDSINQCGIKYKSEISPCKSECSLFEQEDCVSFDLDKLFDVECDIVNHCAGLITKSDYSVPLTDNVVSLEDSLPVQCLNNPSPESNFLSTSNTKIQCQVDTLADINMDSPDIIPSVPDTQPDSFFTWDSGGSSGEYSFVHTAVELPKYPNGSITEEERQMLLLYMQSGHPELLLSGSNVTPTTNLCDPVAVRGFLETIVEENSDDLRSPSECDETSLGWGSWDDEDEDRLTVVEMITTTTNSEVAASDPVYTTADSSQTNGYLSDSRKIRSENLAEIEDQSLCQQIDIKLSGATGVEKCDNLNDFVVGDIKVLPPREMDISCGNKSMDRCSGPGVSPVLSSLQNSNGFDTLWITSDNLESPTATVNPWIKSNFSEDSINALSDMNFLDQEQIAEGHNPLVVLGSDDICLIPSSSFSPNVEKSEENLMFSDDFKDYFLPAENYAMSFNKHDLDKDGKDLLSGSPTSSKPKNLKCFRIGFDSSPNKEQSTPTQEKSLIDIDDDTSLLDKTHNARYIDRQETLIGPGNEYNDFRSMFSHENKNSEFESLFSPENKNSEFESMFSPENKNSDFESMFSPENKNSEFESMFSPENKNSEFESMFSPENKNSDFESMFSPVEGDIVYGSTWTGSTNLKEQEKVSLGAEAHPLTIESDTRCEWSIRPESPVMSVHRRSIPFLDQPLSDDEVPLPNSLSRWRHHTDLQHLQEATSPITRWQHQNLSKEERKQSSESEESDDGLPSQLKEIYSSFKMRDNKMGRIRIKGHKNNNFKKLGLWEKETKVTLPPFATENYLKSKESSREELDDLEFDMFASCSKTSKQTETNCDSDIDDALKSFNHLDDYSSHSDDNSENENKFVVNIRQETNSDEVKSIESLENTDHSSLEMINETVAMSPEMPCSDNSDNCPLCTNTNFKNSHADIFALETNPEHNVQCLLQKTYPQMVGLNNQSSSSDPEIHELNTDVSKTSDSVSPLTSSDSDGGLRIKEVKKRIKKRSKENSNSELKHDDSGYVEEDEDEDDESLEEKKQGKNLKPKSQILSVKESRKSLSTAFLESKSSASESRTSNFVIPESFQKFSEQLELSLSNEEIKSEFLNAGKINFPESLTQFSALLLDKELKNINSREEMEKMLVNDIISLREQTINNFLKSCSIDEREYLKSSDELKYIKMLDSNKEDCKENTGMTESKVSFQHSGTNTIECKELATNTVIEETLSQNQSDDISLKVKSDSDHKLSDEYYVCNFNPRVSKTFQQAAHQTETFEQQIVDNLNSNDNEILKTTEQNGHSLLTNDNKNHNRKLNAGVTENETNINTEIEPVTHCYDNYQRPSELKAPVGDEKSDEPFLPPSGSETAREIQPKVNDATIQKAWTAPSNESIDYQNINKNPSVDERIQNVAASIVEKSSYSTELIGVDPDLLTQRAPEEKGRREAEDFGLLEATHVHLDSRHAHSQDDVFLIVTHDNLDTIEVHDKTFINNFVSHSVSGEIDSGAEEVVCLPVTDTSAATHKERTGEEESSEFTTPDCTDKIIIQREVAADDAGKLVARDTSVKEAGELLLASDSEYLSEEKGDVLLGPADELKESGASENIDKVKTIESCHEHSVTGAIGPHQANFSKVETPKVPKFRAEYKRSNSLGRDNGETEESFELWCGQSKSTPDLRRCHEQQSKSSAPLSALLSKSVSQRIEDYLGRNSRADRLNKSLPPNERSRHYRRICVSTETVVERAARFEAKSNKTLKEDTEDKSYPNTRSGSCPPSSMRGNNASWISDRNYRNYNKPTATVRPTIDVHRNQTQCNGVAKAEKEDLVELITGYTKASKVTHKPPVHPTSTNIHQTLKTARLKGKIANARKDFFERLSQQDLSKDESQDKQEDDIETGTGLNRFDEFRKSAREERARLAASHPDLGALEAAVRSSKRKIDQLKKKKRKSVSQSPPLDAGAAQMPATKDLCLPYRRATGEIAWASCAKRVQDAKSKSKSAREQLEIVDVDSCFGKTGEVRAHPDSSRSAIAAGGSGVDDSCEFFGTRARSMDFLLDADNRERVQPPENRLGSNRVKSEHELRIERSLQNLTVPEWYKQSAWSKGPKEGFILRRGSEGSAGESRKRWQGLGSTSRTPSTTSLSTPPVTYSSQRNIVPRRCGDWRSLVSSRESLTPASPASLSPRECSSAAFQYGLNSSLSRWSSSRLSTSSAPLTALSVHRSFRQPYLGWRAAAASSGGASRSSPGVSPINATTPIQGSRPESPRRGSQDHHYAYGLQQNQITSAATLRPEGTEPTDLNRISPLALNTTNIFFNSNADNSTYDAAQQRCFSTAEMRRDRYSYTQSLYSGTVIVSPCDDENFNVDHQLPRIIHEDDATDDRFRIVRSPQPPPRLWMESSFVGTRKDSTDGASTVPAGRTIRIVPSDAARSGQGPGTGSVRGGTCATQQTTMGNVPTNRKPAFSLKSIHV